MSIEYFSCDICDNTYCDCGEYGYCDKCETSFCEKCSFDYDLKYDDEEEHLINCPVCNNTVVTKKECLDYLYKKLNTNEKEIKKKIIKEKRKKKK